MKPKAIESPYRATQRLEREIKVRYSEIHRIKEATETERLILALKLAGKQKMVFDISHVNDMCVDGKLTAPAGGSTYEATKLAGISGYHGNAYATIKGFCFSISQDDGQATIQIAFDKKEAPTRDLSGNVETARNLLRGFGIAISAKPLEDKRNELIYQVQQIEVLIGAIV